MSVETTIARQAQIRNESGRFLSACRMEVSDSPPVWLMRQAGRYLPEYRNLREKYTILDMIREPELAVEVTLMPLNRFDLDAAILFSDLLPPLAAMGLGLEFVQGEGPVIQRPLKAAKDVDLLPVPASEEVLPETFRAIRMLRPELDTRGIPLIGFAGAPFTLAAYAIEGGGSRNYEQARKFMLSERSAWQRLMKKLVGFQTDYLLAQVRAGVQAIQVFDSWVGVLGKREFIEYVQPYNRQLFDGLKRAGVPIIYFTTRTSAYIEEVAACGADFLSVDSQLPLDEVWKRLGTDKPIQGNLDPLTLFASPREMEFRVREVLACANGRPGHIFNLGHGILPGTDPDRVSRLIELVRGA